MRDINIDFYNSGNTIILGYTNEHLATNLNFVVPAEFRDGYSYKLIFNLENNQEYMELFASYPITYKVSNIIMSAGTSGHLQLSVLKKQDNGEVMVAQSGIIPFKVLSSLADNNTEIGEYTNTIETLIAEFVSNLQNINSRELKANKIVTGEQITNKEENYPSIQYLEDNYPTNDDVYLKDEADSKFLASDGTGNVLTQHLKDRAVTTEKLAINSVGYMQLQQGSVDGGRIANGAITSDKIVNGAITSEKINKGAVIAEKIAPNSVELHHFSPILQSKFNSKLDKPSTDGADGQILVLSSDGSTLWKDIQISTSEIGDKTITTEKIADNAVTTNKIGLQAITFNKIAENAVQNKHILDGSIKESKIADGAVTNNKLAKNSVTTDKIKTGSVTSSKLASDAVTENVLHKDLKAKINSKLDTPDIEGVSGQVLMHTGGNKPVWGTVSGGSGGTGTSNYLELENKPSINNIQLSGNVTTDELGIKNGEDGIGIASIVQQGVSSEDNGKNYITATLTDGTQSTFIILNGSKGSTGTSVTTTFIQESLDDGGTNIVNFSDGKKLSVKNGSKGSTGEKGEKGDTGSAGKDGKDGVGIENIETSISSEDNGLNPIVITLTDGTEYTVYTKNGSKGSQGTSVKVKSVATSLEDDGNNIVKFTDGSTLTIKNGSKGSQGETGDKGDKGETGATGNSGVYIGTEEPTDPEQVVWINPEGELNYGLTEDDKNEIAAIVKSQLSQVEPLFANSIEECTDTTKVYVLPDGFIYAYIKTTAVIPAYTNKVLTSKDASDSVYNGSGYKEGYRLNSSGTETEMEGAVCSGFIPVTKGDVIYILSDSHIPGNTAHYFDTYDSSFTKISTNGGANIGVWSTLNGRYLWTIDTSVLSVTPAYFRCSTYSSGVDFIVSVNEPLDGKETTVETYAWTNTGHAFVPADYENRIIDLEDDVADLKNITTTSNGVPVYVIEEAEVVADKVLAIRNAYSFVFGAISDTHTTGSDTSATSVLHAGMGIDKINEYTQLDLVTNFGDVMVGYLDETYKEGFKHVKSSLNSVSKAVPYIQLQGNHDQLSADTTEEAQQKYFAYIGANNVDTVTDWTNRFRNYGYRDFNDQKMRVIYLNTADVSELENTKDVGISSEQYSWFINTALDFSNIDDEANWGFIVCSHHPLNWYYLDNLLVLLNAYKGKTSGSITTDGTSIAYDFTNATAELIAHFHGHLHNFRVEKLGENEITTITIPNACFGRNNEYGTHSDSEIRNLYGDADENGNQRQFNKTANTAKDTAFNVIVVDRQNRKIHCFNYGAGIDREISY